MPLPDIDDYTATFGGSKVNYSAVEDPTTDEDAGVRNQYVADVAMMTNATPRGWVRFTASAAPALVAHNANWGNAALYAPAVTRTSAGVFVVTLPSSTLDALGNAHTTNVRDAWVNHRSVTTPFFVSVVATSANVLTVYCYSQAGTAADPGADIGLLYI